MAVNEPDETLDPADRRIAALYRHAAGEEAPAYLDARLMAAARQGLAPRAPAVRAPWWSAWRVPFAVAAVAVVSMSLVTLVLDQGGETLTTQAEHPSTAASQSAPPAPAAPSEAAKLAAADASIRGQPPVRSERSPARSAPVDARGIPAAPAPGSGPPAQDSERRADAQPASRDMPRGLQKAQPEAAAPMEAAPVLAAPAASASTPRPEAALRRQEMGSIASRARALPEVERMIAELESRAPPAWIDRIAGLRRDGRTAEADGLLAEFTRRFPDEAVPPGLR